MNNIIEKIFKSLLGIIIGYIIIFAVPIDNSVDRTLVMLLSIIIGFKLSE